MIFEVEGVVAIRPFSTNAMYRGRKVKTKEYKQWQNSLGYLLNKSAPVPEKGPLKLTVHFGISNNGDLDNCLKSFIDALQWKYRFDDRRIMKIDAEKYKAKRGQEAIYYKLEVIEK